MAVKSVLAAALAALVLTGCGSDSDSATTAKAPTAQAEANVSVGAGGIEEALELTAYNDNDGEELVSTTLAAGTMVLDANGTPLQGQLSASTSFSPEQPSGASTVPESSAEGKESAMLGFGSFGFNVGGEPVGTFVGNAPQATVKVPSSIPDASGKAVKVSDGDMVDVYAASGVAGAPGLRGLTWTFIGRFELNNLSFSFELGNNLQFAFRIYYSAPTTGSGS